MFLKNTVKLRDLPPAGKIIISLFLIAAGTSYIFGFLNIFFTYSDVDGRPGMSLGDISLSFYGEQNQTGEIDRWLHEGIFCQGF